MDDENKLKDILLAFFVTILWSSSWIIIKLGLSDISPLLFAGSRYFLASLVLLAFLGVSESHKKILKEMRKKDYLIYILYGIIFIAATQGFIFLALNETTNVTTGFVLNFTSIIVLLLSILLLREYPSIWQVIFVFVTIIGGIIFFIDNLGDIISNRGIVFALLALIANSFSSILGRKINRNLKSSPLIVTSISMFVGSIILLIFAIFIEGITSLSPKLWFYLIWLSVVNTAFAFTIWNKILRRLSSVEASIINNTMLPQIAILSILFLDETVSIYQIIGILLIMIASIFVNYNPMSSAVND